MSNSQENTNMHIQLSPNLLEDLPIIQEHPNSQISSKQSKIPSNEPSTTFNNQLPMESPVRVNNHSSVLSNQSNVSFVSSTSERQAKQHFLRDQIIEAGFDPNDFVKYLNSQLEIESDLDRCSLQQLEEVVERFKQRKKQEKIELYKYYTDEDTEQVEPSIIRNSTVKLQKVIVRANPEIIEDQYFTQAKCVKVIDKFSNIKGSIQCQVKNPERKYLGGILGIGGSSFLCFQVWSHGLNKDCVSRRYSDFIWLRNLLTKFYPSFIVPPIPNKKASKRLPRQITKRMRILQYFLNDLVKVPVFLNNKYVQGFFAIKDQRGFQKLKEDGENRKSYESILSTQTLTGTVTLELSNKTKKYNDALKKFVPDLEHLYKQITRNSKKMKTMTFEKINLIYEMANQFGQLFDKSSKFNSFIKSESSEKLSQIYAVLNNMMVEWGNSLKKEIDQVQKNLSTFFKYARQQLIGASELIERTTAAQDIWIRQKQSLDKLKQKVFQLKDPKKWDLPKKDIVSFPKSAIYDRTEAFKLMLPKQSVQVQNLKQNYAYYLAQLYEHGNQNFLKTTDNFCNNFKQFSIKMKVNNQEIGSMWAEVAYKFSDPYKKTPIVRFMQMEGLQEESESQGGTYDD